MTQSYDNDFELVIKFSKRLENLLKERFGAEGRGLHEKIDSVEGQLSDEIARKLRYIATVRNKLVHEEEYNNLENRQRFVNTCQEVESALGSQWSTAGSHTRGRAGGNGCLSRLFHVLGTVLGIIVLVKIAESVERQDEENRSP